MSVTIKFDQIASPVSEHYKSGQIVVASFLSFETGAGKVVSVNDATQEVTFEAATKEEAASRIEQVFSHLDPRTNNVDNFKTGAKVEVKDPVWFDEIRNGFVAKQLDDRHFLVKLEMPFTRTNPQSEWLEVSRDYAHQTVKEI